jgi:glycerol-3-phosphate dehydrogenase (NAD(P)+)
MVWGREGEGLLEELRKTRRNGYVELPASVQFTSDLKEAIAFADKIVVAISAQAMKEFSMSIGATQPNDKIFVLCMKGIIDETGERLSEVLARHINASNEVCVWVGPGHVQELTTGQPNVMIVDGTSREAVRKIINSFESDLIKLYEGDDLIGVEVGAAAKNVMGIMAGLLDGAGLTSLKGALMARGVYEVSRLIVAMGGRQLTAYGISHIGDYEATLFSSNSHNRKFGESFMKGSNCTELSEGVATAKALRLLAKKYHVDMPISDVCYRILHGGEDPMTCLRELFARTNKREFRGE